jgi:hypothetical protein
VKQNAKAKMHLNETMKGHSLLLTLVYRIDVQDELKCGLCKNLLLYECNPDQLPTFFQFVITFGWVQQQSNSKPPKSDDRMKKKWATGQSCIRKEVTSYKIHTLNVQVGKFLKNIKRAGWNRRAGGNFSGISILVQVYKTFSNT